MKTVRASSEILPSDGIPTNRKTLAENRIPRLGRLGKRSSTKLNLQCSNEAYDEGETQMATQILRNVTDIMLTICPK